MRSWICVMIALAAAISTPEPMIADCSMGPGLSEPPDSLGAGERNCLVNCSGVYKFAPCSRPEFTFWEHSLVGTLAIDESVNLDFDLFISNSFEDEASIVFTQVQIDSLLVLFHDRTNVLGDTTKHDFALVHDYFSVDNAYDGSDTTGHIELFLECSGVPLSDRNHVDLYVALHDIDASGGSLHPFTDPREDLPRETCPAPEEQEMFANAIGVTSPGGDFYHWKYRIAGGLFHEYGHLLRTSNPCATGNDSRVNELFACGGGYLTKLPYFPPKDDTLYDLSVFRCPGDVEKEHYRHWNAFAGYLLEQYKLEDMEDQLLYKWARETCGDALGRVHVSKCALAYTLNDTAFSELGGTGETPGCFRMGKLFAKFFTALWVNSDGVNSDYYFSDYFTPWQDSGFFTKVADPGHCWEDVLAPEHVVGADADSAWIDVPGLEDCWSDEDECADPDTGTWCEPIRVKTWGGNWIVFRTDTSYYDGTEDMDLRVRIRWPELPDSQRIWLTAVEYPDEKDELYKYGAEAPTIRGPGHYTASTDSIEFWVSDFTSGNTEAMTLVITVSDTILENPCYGWPGPYPVKSVEYDYSYGMFPSPTGGGCPFVFTWDGEAYVEDNNVLASRGSPAMEGLDAYVLRERPVEDAGLYRLTLREDENERSYIDSLSLAVVDHPADTFVSVDPEYDVTLHSSPMAPTHALFDGEVEVTDVLASPDGHAVTIGPETTLEVTLPWGRSGTGLGGGIVLRGMPSHKIEQPFKAAVPGPSELNLDALHGRENVTTWFLSVPDSASFGYGSVSFRVTSHSEYSIDCIGVAGVVDDMPTVTQCELLAATHSAAGDVRALVGGNDHAYASLESQEQLELVFRAPPQTPESDRDFVLLTAGFYEGPGAQLPRTGGTGNGLKFLAGGPNPFGTSTSVRFVAANYAERVTLRVYDLAGRRVRTLLDSELASGEHTAHWDGTDDRGQRVASGVYFFRLAAPGVDDLRKVVVLR